MKPARVLVTGIAAVGLVLTGCTTPPAPAPAPSIPDASDAPTTVDASGMTATDTPTVIPTADPSVSTLELTCVPPTDAISNWVKQQFIEQQFSIAGADIVTFDVGQGNQPGSDWWIVATNASPWSMWLTNAPSTTIQPTWIPINPLPDSNGQPTFSQSASWVNIQWTADRLVW